MINRSKMRRQLYTGGGIASLQRQGYGLGDIVKKAGKVVKQVFKSDVGKAALLGAGLYGLGGGTFFGKGFPGMGGGFSMGNILPNIKGLSTVGKAALGTGAALAFGGGDPTKTKGFDMAKRKGSVEEYLRRYYKEYKQSDWQTGWTQDEEDAFVAKYTTEYNQGGRVGLQAGGLPAVDPRMKRTLTENVAANEAQRMAEEGAIKAENLRMRGMGQRAPQQSRGVMQTLGDASGYTQHNINNQLIKNALTERRINENQYKRMGGYDVAQQLPGGVLDVPITAAATLGYQGAKSLAGAADKLGWIDDTLGLSKYGEHGAWESADLNVAGAQGLNPADLQTYKSITGEYKPVGGMYPGGEKELMPQASEDPLLTKYATKAGEGIYNVLNPEDAAATPTAATMADVAGPAQGETYADGATTIPGFTKLKNPDGAPGNYNEFMYKGPDGQIYGSQTYSSIAAGQYPDIYDPNKQTLASGGRVGLYAGGDPEDYPETGPEINIQDLIQEEGIQVGPQVKKLDAGAPSIKRTGNMETEDSQLVERYNEHKEEGGTMSFDEFEKFESMTAYYPGDVFSRAEISALFRDSSLTTNLDRKQLHKILMNPGMFPEAESMLIKLLRSGNAYGGRVGAFGGGVMGGRVGLKVLRDLFNDEEEAAQGGRIGYDAGVGPVGSLAMNEESVPQLWLSDEAGALPKTEGGVLPGDLGNLTIDDFDNIEDYMRYLRMMNQNNQGGRIGAFGGGVMGIGTPGMGLPGIPQMAPDGLEYNMKAGGFQNLGAKEGKDDVKANLAKNEFVMTADAVRGAGGGNIEVGAQRMYDTMKQLEGKVA